MKNLLPIVAIAVAAAIPSFVSSVRRRAAGAPVGTPSSDNCDPVKSRTGFPPYRLVLLLLAVLGSVNSASAGSSIAARETEVAVCIRKAAQGRAWLERTLWGLRDQEGGWIGAAIANTNGTYDLGPLQVNSWWVPKIAALVKRPEAHVRYWLQNDACFNAETARWIFLSGLSVTGDYWKAIGVYHSPTAWRQTHYVKSVVSHLQKRYGDALW